VTFALAAPSPPGHQELAEKVGITVAALSRIERNSAEPWPKTRRKLAEALEVDPTELVED
jgi:transcriptional regulator with XRE-family HTH domain